ncbi:MAG: response regulator transcription factor [Prolixibacteraceae bacterium]|nr:response regulator transcription factor [Burkholderiales bacterium]
MPTRATSIATVVIDDEKLALEELLYLLKDYPEVEVVASADNGIQGVEIIEKYEPDIVFLDVQMPGLDGMGVIRTLREHSDELPYFVLVTAYENYAIEAFSMEALDYLLKPVEKVRLDRTIERAQRLFSEQRAGEPFAVTPRPKEQRTKILVKSAGRSFIVDAQDIVYATIDEGIITIVTSAVEGESNYKTIEELQSNLDPETFWRVHRSYLVNINRIREVIPWFKSSYQIRMDDKKQTEIPVSRVQTKRLRSLLKL